MKVNFEIKAYEVKIGREFSGSTGGMFWYSPAYIICRGDEYHTMIFSLTDDTPVPENTFQPDSKRGTIFVPRWQFKWFLDLLRNEKPVYCFLNSTHPKWNSLYTGDEPVGEDETAL